MRLHKPELVFDTSVVQNLLQWYIHAPTEVLYELVIPDLYLDVLLLWVSNIVRACAHNESVSTCG